MIIASNLREITSCRYKVVSYPALDTSHAIGENLIMTAITEGQQKLYFLHWI